MPDDYIEFFVKWTPSAVVDVARQWLEQHGFTVEAMRSGASLLGTRNQIERTFSVSLENMQLPMNLPVPAELREHVELVTIPRPRSYHA